MLSKSPQFSFSITKPWLITFVLLSTTFFWLSWSTAAPAISYQTHRNNDAGTYKKPFEPWATRSGTLSRLEPKKDYGLTVLSLVVSSKRVVGFLPTFSHTIRPLLTPVFSALLCLQLRSWIKSPNWTAANHHLADNLTGRRLLNYCTSCLGRWKANRPHSIPSSNPNR